MLKSVLYMSLLLSQMVLASDLTGPLLTGWQGKSVCEKLSENADESILRCTFPPGIGHEKHRHNAHFGYAISGGKMKIIDKTGTKEVMLSTGSYFESPGKSWHSVVNIGETTVIYLMIESKTPFVDNE